MGCPCLGLFSLEGVRLVTVIGLGVLCFSRCLDWHFDGCLGLDFSHNCFADFACSHHPCLGVYECVCVCAVCMRECERTCMRTHAHLRACMRVCAISQSVRDITVAIREKVGYLPSNGATAKVVHCDFDLYFQGHNIS